MTTIPVIVAGTVAAPGNEDTTTARPAAAINDDKLPPISKERLRLCYERASHWAEVLPAYACRQQFKADNWSLAAGVLAAVTGLAVFPTADNGGVLETTAISIAAFLAAIFALVPRVKNYGEMAGKAREVAALYGPLKGDLLDALQELETGQGSDTSRRKVVEAYQVAKAKKDELRYLPD